MSTLQSETIDLEKFKLWLVKRLEDISDADSDVLADYVIALVQSDEPDEQIRSNCIENLKDFLQDNTDGFVNDVFTTIREKSYLPGYKAPTKPTNLPGLNANAQSFNPNSFTQPTPHHQGNFGGLPSQQQSLHVQQQHPNDQSFQSKKRSWSNRDNTDQSQQTGRNGERPQKQMRRGGQHGVRGGRGGSQAQMSQQQPSMLQMPGLPAGFPPFDPNNPMSSVMAMQAMGFPMPGLDQMGMVPPPLQQQQQKKTRKGRCRDYDTKGFCAKGSSCPYEHGSDHIVVSEEYDPANSSLMLDIPQSTFQPNSFSQQSNIQALSASNSSSRARQQRRGRGRDQQQRNGRSSISLTGPNHDTRITSIVVEQIPEESFNAEAVQSFFSEFGEIDDVNLQNYKRLAVVRFKDYQSAKNAYESPKVVFDNRFVKVYWHKPSDTNLSLEPIRKAVNGQINTPDTMNGHEKLESAEPELDPEEFAKKQAEAQRAHEEKLRKIAETETARLELDKKIKAQAEERRKLMEKLAAKAKSPSTETNRQGNTTTSTTTNGTGSTEDPKVAQKAKTTEALRAKLAALEAEAEAMGLPAEDPSSGGGYGPKWAPRGRGGFRGRGRGAMRGSWNGGSVARLDNRPKSVKLHVVGEDADLASEEMLEKLRAWLYSIGPFTSIIPSQSESPIPTSKQTDVIISFQERYIAEMFIASTSHTGGSIPGLGKVELNWSTPGPSTTGGAGAGASAAGSTGNPATSVGGPGATAVNTNGNAGINNLMDVSTVSPAHVSEPKDVDYDVADEMDSEDWY